MTTTHPPYTPARCDCGAPATRQGDPGPYSIKAHYAGCRHGDDTRVISHWTYLGRRRLLGERRARHVWEEHDTGRRYRLAKQFSALARVGATYAVTSEGDQFFTGGEFRPRPVGRPAWVTDELIAGWCAEDAAALADLERERLAGDLPDLGELLLPLKRVYHGQRDRHRKAAVLAAVIAELQRW